MKTRIWEKTAFRTIIFLLCALFVAGSICLLLLGSARLGEFQARQSNTIAFVSMDAFSPGGFLDSETFHLTARNKVNDVGYLFNDFVDGDKVSVARGPAYERAVDDQFRYLYNNVKDSIEWAYDYHGYDGYDEYGEHVFNWWGFGSVPLVEPLKFDALEIAGSTALVADGKIKSFDEPGVRLAFEALYPDQSLAVKQEIAADREKSYAAAMRNLDGVLYYASDGENTLSSVDLDGNNYPADPAVFGNQPAWIVIEAGDTYASPASLARTSGLWSYLGRTSLHIAWPEDVLASYEAYYNEGMNIMRTYFFTAAALAALVLASAIWLIVFTGRKRPSYENTRKLWALDKIFVEFQVVLMAIVLTVGLFIVSEGSRVYWNNTQGVDILQNNLYIAFYSALGFACSAVVLWFVLSLVRIGKAGLFAERSLIAIFANGPCKRLGDAIKTGYDGTNPLAKTLIFVIVFWVITAFLAGVCGLALMLEGAVASIFLALLLLVLGGSIYLTRKWVERYGRLRKGIEEISSGNLGYRIDIEGDGKNEFDKLSALVNELGTAQNTAIQNELKNQRLKTDLISNVSHDLKTPLTSILTYTDLLKTEGLKSKNAEEYLAVIDEKGQRLQKLTEDLFDAAKASSGAMNVRKERVDLLELVNQEIAEINGGFAASGLEVVIDAEDGCYYAEADSQLLWRVVDNLLRNVRKYAQSGTRVYINLKEHQKMVTLEIKNTSATKLNIPPEELMERFKRGDEARTTEGSGLGLAIAKDLVLLQGGWFDISIDGDLFKATVMLPPFTPNV
ncbi:MAG: HAMP domain-containing histidine kinase [Clostridiales bacterium]|nr:HAMP domain-containing histidine kinase [Clostridiales bacterium]